MSIRIGLRNTMPTLAGFLTVMVTAGIGLSVALAPAEAAPPAGSAISRAAEPRAAPFELTEHGAPGRPLRWQACDGIDYRVDRRSMPPRIRPVIERTMRIISRQTGVRFHDAGDTERRFDDTARIAKPTIFFSFTAKRSAFGETLAWPGEVGVGGPIAGPGGSGERGADVITAGRVLLSTAFDGPRYGAGATWQSLVTHEVGHALNLAHRSGTDDMMNEVLSARSPGRLRADEVVVLSRVLQRTGCWDRSTSPG